MLVMNKSLGMESEKGEYRWEKGIKHPSVSEMIDLKPALQSTQRQFFRSELKCPDVLTE